jgi:hypothetical protein
LGTNSTVKPLFFKGMGRCGRRKIRKSEDLPGILFAFLGKEADNVFLGDDRDISVQLFNWSGIFLLQAVKKWRLL